MLFMIMLFIFFHSVLKEDIYPIPNFMYIKVFLNVFNTTLIKYYGNKKKTGLVNNIQGTVQKTDTSLSTSRHALSKETSQKTFSKEV